MPMTLLEMLYQQYGTNEPILLSEITFEDYSRPWIMKQLQLLCESGDLCKYEKGVYYVPTDTFFGKSILNPRKVIEKKYINDSRRIIGYYSGITLQNQLKITTQMPNVLEIYTNNESSKVREVTVGSQRVVLRRARVEINRDNVPILAFLELMNDITPNMLDDDKKERIAEYIDGNIIMLAFRSFLFKICTKRFIPVTDIFCGIVKGIPEVSGTSFLHMGITVV